MDEREFELINIIGGELGSNQRDISRQMKLSLGMTNMLVKRLITKGYIRIRQLDKKKVEYILTPKGFSEKMQKSVRYTMKTVGSIGLIRKSIGKLLEGLYQEGVRKFYIYGSADLTDLIQMEAHRAAWQDCQMHKVHDGSPLTREGVLLLCREQLDLAVPEGLRVINVVETLASEAYTQELASNSAG